jgi:hypothetical protein
MSKQVTVQYTIEGRWSLGGSASMTRKQYSDFCARLDANPRGYEVERIADELMLLLGVDFRNGEIDSLEITDFNEKQATP